MKGQKSPRSPRGSASPARGQPSPAPTKSNAHSPKVGAASPKQGSPSPRRQKPGASPKPGGSSPGGASPIPKGSPAKGRGSPTAEAAASPTFELEALKPDEWRQPAAPEKGRWRFGSILGVLRFFQGSEAPARQSGGSPARMSPAGSHRPSVVAGTGKRQPEAIKAKSGTSSPQGSQRSGSPRPSVKALSPKKHRAGSPTHRTHATADRDSVSSFIDYVSSRSKILLAPKSTSGMNFRMVVVLCCVAVLLAVIVIAVAWKLVSAVMVPSRAAAAGKSNRSSSGKHGRSCTGENCSIDTAPPSWTAQPLGTNMSPVIRRQR